MPKLTEEQLNAIISLPYYSKIKDLIPLFESGILSQVKFNEELLKERENYKPNPTSILSSEGIEMVLVEGGTFDMGCNEYDDEKPIHSVTVGDFYIGKTEVTQAQWKTTMGDNPSYFKGDNLPVETVAWYDAVEFCNKLSEMAGLQKCYSGSNITCNFKANGYRLPTEAEWEYAARGGNQSKCYKYSGSSNVDDVAWYSFNSGSKTQPVGVKNPNELGIYDMSGNVWEWCSDWYDSNYYKNSPSNNPTGPSSGPFRVVRGGSWGDSYGVMRCAIRDGSHPDGCYYLCRGLGSSFGFRVARTK
jgi:formylglycine-generating enzyme required for sulfatase activity